MLSRPTASEVAEYRAYVDAAMERLLRAGVSDEIAALIRLGINHEEQHQELILTDILHAFSKNPLRPSYREATGFGRASGASPTERPRAGQTSADAPPLAWHAFEGGVRAIGHDGRGFGFDNEFPRHDVLVRPFSLASRPVTCGEWKRFIADGGYRRPELWLSDGWAAVCEQGWEGPRYWELREDGYWQMTLDGMRPVEDDAPVCHVSYYEADAFAHWFGARLPTEAEWEIAAQSARADSLAEEGSLRTGALAPRPPRGDGALEQMRGEVWEWTASPYGPYPGYRPPAGAVGEYNGKFMCNQIVLRGGSALTPPGHARITYRNFFYPDTRWQMAGVRLAVEGGDAAS